MKKEHIYTNEWEEQFLMNRPFLISFAFRMTGSLSIAEDIVQDTYLSCLETDPLAIKNHKAWLTKVCSNKALDHLKLAYKKRETYTGLWLPDAVPESFQIWSSHIPADEVDNNLLITESLTTTFLLLAEKLSPVDRVTYLLSEVFEYSYKEISELLNKSEDSCRKSAQRAREAMQKDQPKYLSSIKSEKLISSFFEHAKKGNKEAMIQMLAPKSEFWSDGGGKVTAVAIVMKEPAKIAQFFTWLGSTSIFRSEDYKIEFLNVNARPGMVISKKLLTGLWSFESILTFEVEDNQIIRIYSQRNPEKLDALLKFK